MVALIIGSLLAVAGVAYVLLPLLRAASVGAHAPSPSAPLPAPESSAIEALREIEFDRATGKLSDEDYAALKAQYTPRALEELRARDQQQLNAEVGEVGEDASQTSATSAFKKAVAVESPDAAEALIAVVSNQGLVCPIDGLRPESDALFCSECGRELVASTATAAR